MKIVKKPLYNSDFHIILVWNKIYEYIAGVSMRVIAGSARRLLLKTLDGLDTRPTTDRIKETLFNMLQPSIPDCLFLDLFSGSGAIAIEALSRGAKLAVLVENNRSAVEISGGPVPVCHRHRWLVRHGTLPGNAGKDPSGG